MHAHTLKFTSFSDDKNYTILKAASFYTGWVAKETLGISCVTCPATESVLVISLCLYPERRY